MTGAVTRSYVSTARMSHMEWLAARQGGIGGSDAAALVLTPDVYKWHRPIDVYRSKVYELPEEEESLACRMGHFLEPLVADLFTEETGYRVHRWNRMLTSSEFPWAFANIDRKLRGYDRGLECKTCSVYRERQFDDEMFPPEYYVQIQHYLAVTGWDTWYLAALIGNKRFVWYTVPRNDEDIKEIMEREEAFWQIIIDKNEEEAEQWL